MNAYKASLTCKEVVTDVKPDFVHKWLPDWLKSVCVCIFLRNIQTSLIAFPFHRTWITTKRQLSPNHTVKHKHIFHILFSTDLNMRQLLAQTTCYSSSIPRINLSKSRRRSTHESDGLLFQYLSKWKKKQRPRCALKLTGAGKKKKNWKLCCSSWHRLRSLIDYCFGGGSFSVRVTLALFIFIWQLYSWRSTGAIPVGLIQFLCFQMDTWLSKWPIYTPIWSPASLCAYKSLDAYNYVPCAESDDPPWDIAHFILQHSLLHHNSSLTLVTALPTIVLYPLSAHTTHNVTGRLCGHWLEVLSAHTILWKFSFF